MQWDNKNPDKWELYDMEKDRTEMYDLSAKMANKVNEMKQMWQEWANRSQVEPWKKVESLEAAKRKN
jgi:arylsulfatase